MAYVEPYADSLVPTLTQIANLLEYNRPQSLGHAYQYPRPTSFHLPFRTLRYHPAITSCELPSGTKTDQAQMRNMGWNGAKT